MSGWPRTNVRARTASSPLTTRCDACVGLTGVMRRPHGRQERNALTVDEMDVMDLVTLVTACSLTIDPKIMHALIWHQSGGEPWAFTVPGERQSQVYQTVSEAVRCVRAVDRDDVPIRFGLTGLSADPRSATAAMFAPCANITIAARQIAQLGERCKTSPRFKDDPMYCAIAAYHGAWERPDTAFADAVRTSVAKNDAPDFEMPTEPGTDFSDAKPATPPAFHDTATAPPRAPDDRQRGWSSALFPAKSQQLGGPPTSKSARDPRAEDAHTSAPPQARSPHA